MILSTNAYNGLTKIARKTKCDCWFDIRQDKNGNDYVFDLENRKRLSLRTGVGQLAEGMVEPLHSEFYNLNECEIRAVFRVFARLKVGGYDTVSRCTSLMCDIEYEMNKVDLNNPQDMDDGYQYMVSIIETSGFFLQYEKDEMLAILNDDSLSLIDSYSKVCEYLEKKIEASGKKGRS